MNIGTFVSAVTNIEGQGALSQADKEVAIKALCMEFASEVLAGAPAAEAATPPPPVGPKVDPNVSKAHALFAAGKTANEVYLELTNQGLSMQGQTEAFWRGQIATLYAAEPTKTLRQTQQTLADNAVKGKGNPPPILPAHTFNPVLSQAGLPQVWYNDEPNGGWPAPIDQDNKDGKGVWYATNPTGGGYFTSQAAIDAMPAPRVTPDWAAAQQRMKDAAQGAQTLPVPQPTVVVDPDAPVVEG